MLDLIRHPQHLKDTLGVRAFGLAKVPLLLFVSPTVVALNEDRVVFKIPFLRRNRNHLNCMYFGVLCCGADLAGGYLAVRTIAKSKEKISLIFKDVKAEFLKRAEGATLFTCEDGPAIREMVEETARTGERVHRTVTVVATCPDKLGEEPVARFALTLSLKKKAKK